MVATTLAQVEILSEKINSGLDQKKQSYAKEVYSQIFNSDKTIESYMKCILPMARYIVEQTNMPEEKLATKLIKYAHQYIKTDENGEFIFDIPLEIKQKYPTSNDSFEAKLSILACEFVNQELEKE